MTLEKQGLTPVVRSEVTQSITGTSNDTDTRIEGASRGDAEKAGQKIYSKQSLKTDNFTKLKKKSINSFVKVFS